jgi:hypothetical protein
MLVKPARAKDAPAVATIMIQASASAAHKLLILIIPTFIELIFAL